MVLYIIYKDVKVLKEQLKLHEHLATAAKLGEIKIDLQGTIEEIIVKEEKEAEKEGAKMSLVWGDQSLIKEKDLGLQNWEGGKESVNLNPSSSYLYDSY